MIPSPIRESMDSGYFDFCPTCSTEIPGVGEYRVCVECADEPPIFNANDDKKIIIRTPKVQLPIRKQNLTAWNLARLDSGNRRVANKEFLKERPERRTTALSDKADDDDEDEISNKTRLKLKIKRLRIGVR